MACSASRSSCLYLDGLLNDDIYPAPPLRTDDLKKLAGAHAVPEDWMDAQDTSLYIAGSVHSCPCDVISTVSGGSRGGVYKASPSSAHTPVETASSRRRVVAAAATTPAPKRSLEEALLDSFLEAHKEAACNACPPENRLMYTALAMCPLPPAKRSSAYVAMKACPPPPAPKRPMAYVPVKACPVPLPATAGDGPDA